MKAITEDAMAMKHKPLPADSAPLWKRIGWMAAIWLGSVLGLGLVAQVLRYWLA